MHSSFILLALLAIIAVSLAAPRPEHSAFLASRQQSPPKSPKAGQGAKSGKSPKSGSPTMPPPTEGGDGDSGEAGAAAPPMPGGKGPAQAPQGSGSPPPGNKYLLLFARGTTEPGTMGASVGPKLSSAFKRRFPNTRVEGVPYPADFSGAFSGGTNPKGAKGSQNMAKMARAGIQKGERVVLSGYSQGAEQVHGALLNLGPDGSRIYAAVTFGDPLKKWPQWGSLPAARAKIYCNQGDGVCGGAFAISAAHLSYGSAVTDSVNFVAGLAKAG